MLELHELHRLSGDRRDRRHELRLGNVDRDDAARAHQRQDGLRVKLLDVDRAVTTLAFHPG